MTPKLDRRMNKLTLHLALKLALEVLEDYQKELGDG